MELTEKQKDAITKGTKWFKDEDYSKPFVIAGVAGSGKSSVVKFLVEQLGLDNLNTVFCTFTGKAALVLSRKGNPACTIHRLIYEPMRVVDYVSKKDGSLGSVEDYLREPESYYEKEKMVFSRKFFLDPSIKLIIVDEVSMVNKEMIEDLMSFGIPIICLGDSAQIPIISGEDNGLLNEPDVFLDEIHRQAADNPIVYLSMLARGGKRIDPGLYKLDGKLKVAVISKQDELPDELLLKTDQVICGKNKTRQELNSYIRKLLGFTGNIPNKGEKLVCLKNDWNKNLQDVTLINGLIGYVQDDVLFTNWEKKSFQFNFRPEFLTDQYFEGLTGDLRRFTNNGKFDENLSKKDPSANEFDYGYAITCHKSQGSEWSNVLVYHEYLGPEMNQKWLYTAITRSSSRLVLYI